MLRFTLGGATSGAPGRAAAASGVVRVDRGALTERIVKQAADAGARLVLAPRAVITPLAREKARALGVEIERER
jgi:2-keto-3-deoxy-L-rhamnonate aldolase RhmA